MKPHLDIAHQGNLGSDRVRMRFDQDSIAHLMSILTDLYSNPTLAVIREYSTNAADAQRAAGSDLPVLVTLPTMLSPTFIVKDFGVGLSLADINENVSAYGWSSKRDNDDEVGMLGLGFKSGLSYTSQFTVVSVKDGFKCVVLVTREDDGAGAVQTIDTSATDEPNGVEIRVPVSNVNHFNQTARNFFRFWEPGTVLIDGEPPQTIDQDFVIEEDSIYLTKDPHITHDMLVMGNVAYPVESPATRLVAYEAASRSHLHAIVKVPIGSIDFTPSRESLHYTKRTTEVVDAARDFIRHTVRKVAQVEIDAAPNHGAAYDTIQKWRTSYPGAYSYQGQEAPGQQFVLPKGAYAWNARSGTGERAYKISHFQGSERHRYLQIYNYRANGMTADAKRKAKDWIAKHHMNEVDTFNRSTISTVITYPGPPVHPLWLDDCPKVDWDVLRLIDGPKVATKRVSGTHRVLDRNGRLKGVDDLPDNPVFMSTSVTMDRYMIADAAETAGVQVIVVPAAGVDKFKAKFPQVSSLQAHLAREQRLAAKALTDADKEQLFFYVGSWQQDGIRPEMWRLPADRVLDPELRNLCVKMADYEYARTRRYEQMTNICKKMRISIHRPDERTPLTPLVKEARKAYPLIDQMENISYGRHTGRSGVDLMVEYVNGLFIARTALLGRECPISITNQPTKNS